MLEHYGGVFIFAVVGIGFSVVSLLLAALLRNSGRKDALKMASYECGMPPVGSTEAKINIRFYLFALLFVLFEVEVLYVFPWAVNARQLGAFALLEMLIFLGILFIGLLYAWNKGALQWE